eukprot:74461_1
MWRRRKKYHKLGPHGVLHTFQIYNYMIHVRLDTLSQVLSITINCTATKHQWKQQFVQMNFDNINLYKVTKILVEALQPQNIITQCKIIIYSNYCYLTIDNCRVLPSFPLPLFTFNYNDSNYTINYNNNTPSRKRASTNPTCTNIQTHKHKYANGNTKDSYKNTRQSSQSVTTSSTQTPVPIPQPPPVTLDMLINYSKHNISNNSNENDTIQLNEKLKELNFTKHTYTYTIPPPPKRIDNKKNKSEICEQNDNKSIDNVSIVSYPTLTSDSGTSDDIPTNNNILKCNISGMDNDKYNKLLTIYNNYVKDKHETPGTSFDLINYIQFNGISGINFRDVGRFLIAINETICKLDTD